MIKVLIAIVLTIGVFCIFDARRITRRYFTRADRNKTTEKVRIVGYILTIIALLIYAYIYVYSNGVLDI